MPGSPWVANTVRSGAASKYHGSGRSCTACNKAPPEVVLEDTCSHRGQRVGAGHRSPALVDERVDGIHGSYPTTSGVVQVKG